ncbi:MAG TPA: GNAT family N-acetyltransferase [Bacillota bacterium]|nr:GNAT family N-acetyltransferase [Bacillota bacterium]HPJ85466.1 GNAT family N-acetyltransferase [Bacillota bacterium]
MSYIIIRETKEKYLPDLMNMWNDGEVMKYVNYPNGLGMNGFKMESWYKWLQSQGDTKHFIILDDETGFLGETFYCYAKKNKPASLDIKLIKNARGRHVGNLALSYAIDMLFKNTKAMTAYVDPNKENLPALSLYKRLGFEKVEKQNDLYPDAVYMEINREKWQKQRLESIRLAPIDRDNVFPVCFLKVKDDQKNFVATNSLSLAQAAYQTECIPHAIYCGYNLVGFLMHATDEKDGLQWIYRLMIDRDFQGLGYGEKAMKIVMDTLKKQSKSNRIRISFEPTNKIARQLYEKLGFVDSGQMDGDETIYEYTWQ